MPTWRQKSSACLYFSQRFHKCMLVARIDRSLQSWLVLPFRPPPSCRAFFDLAGGWSMAGTCWPIRQWGSRGVWRVRVPPPPPLCTSNVSLSGCPRSHPGPTVLSTHCPGSWGPGSRGLSGWNRIPSCGGSRSTPPCPTRPWCSMCRWWRWGIGPRPWSRAWGPAGMVILISVCYSLNEPTAILFYFLPFFLPTFLPFSLSGR